MAKQKVFDKSERTYTAQYVNQLKSKIAALESAVGIAEDLINEEIEKQAMLLPYLNEIAKEESLPAIKRIANKLLGKYCLIPYGDN